MADNYFFWAFEATADGLFPAPAGPTPPLVGDWDSEEHWARHAEWYAQEEDEQSYAAGYEYFSDGLWQAPSPEVVLDAWDSDPIGEHSQWHEESDEQNAATPDTLADGLFPAPPGPTPPLVGAWDSEEHWARQFESLPQDEEEQSFSAGYEYIADGLYPAPPGPAAIRIDRWDSDPLLQHAEWFGAEEEWATWAYDLYADVIWPAPALQPSFDAWHSQEVFPDEEEWPAYGQPEADEIVVPAFSAGQPMEWDFDPNAHHPDEEPDQFAALQDDDWSTLPGVSMVRVDYWDSDASIHADPIAAYAEEEAAYQSLQNYLAECGHEVLRPEVIVATKRRRSDAAEFTESQTITVGGTWLNGDTITVTINGKDLILTVGATVSTTAIATDLAATWNGDAIADSNFTRNNTGNLIPEANLVTASVVGSVVSLTYDAAGTPFTVSIAKSSASGTVTLATSVAATGPKFWNNADNWTTNAVPVSTDDIWIENDDQDILYALDQNSVVLTSLNILASYLGNLGLRDQSELADYFEYLETYLRISATTLNIGEGPGQGSPRLRIDVGANVCTVNVSLTGSAPDAGIPALLWKGTNVGNVANIRKGDVGIAWLPGETSIVDKLRVGFIDNKEGDATVRCGSGLTLTTLDQIGGNVTLNAGLTTANITAGILAVRAGAVTTINGDGGTIYWDGTGTITTLKLGEGCELNASRDQRPFTITNCTLSRGAIIRDPFRRITFANPFTLDRCGIGDVTLELGEHITLQRANAA